MLYLTEIDGDLREFTGSHVRLRVPTVAYGGLREFTGYRITYVCI